MNALLSATYFDTIKSREKKISTKQHHQPKTFIT